MGLDLQRLQPAELVRLLNSGPLGAVTSEKRLRTVRMRAGYHISQAGSSQVSLVRFAAWLRAERSAKLATPRAAGPTGYDAHRERMLARSKAMSASVRNIGEIPEVRDQARRARAERSLRAFAEAYFPQTFRLAWSEDHLRVLRRLEEAVLEGGLFALAMPRGSGKTSLCEVACMWAIVFGHRAYVALVGADEDHAAMMLDSIKTELENNELLLEDFPEVCFPIHALERIHQRASGQLYHGKPTDIGWTADRVVLPTIPGSVASSAIINVAGITGRVRGMKHKRPDGRAVRPDLVLVDDPQTDESARSPSQCAVRERILAGAILGLAGPGAKIAGLMTLTVVRPDDMADRILNRDLHPEWNGERTQMIYAFPTNEALWQQYAKLRSDGLKAGRGLAEATEFYRVNQTAMDEGAKVAWSARFNSDELSAIQHAMNLRLADEHAFFAEYQNTPKPEVSDAAGVMLSAEMITSRANGAPRGTVPADAAKLTAFVDVQAKVLFWMVVAWRPDFSGHIVAYGGYPEQKGIAYYTARDAKRTLSDLVRNAGLEPAIYAGLDKLTTGLAARDWKREDGSILRIERLLIDANWGESTDTVYDFCRSSSHAAVITPSHGRYIGAASLPMSEYTRRKGEFVGLNWRVPAIAGKRTIRHVVFDTNFWKSFIAARLAVEPGDPGSLTVHGAAAEHQMLIDHLTSEQRITTQGRGRTVDEWRMRETTRDNHWWDCLVGAAVAASMCGVQLDPTVGMRRVAGKPAARRVRRRRP